MSRSEYVEICSLISSRLSVSSLSADLQFEAMQRLMLALSNPQDSVPAVHVAGTNGKGSTAAFISSITRAAGIKTGLFTSPHLERFNERIVVDGREISDNDFVRLAKKIILLDGQLGTTLTGFAILTALAFLYFIEQNCQIMVIETGLGGRLDATNVINTPVVSVLTAIDYDHVKILGTTLLHIAAEKCGIIKANCPVVALKQTPAVNDVIAAVARRNNSRLSWCNRAEIHAVKKSLAGQLFNYGEFSGLKIKLLGDYQLTNACAALLAVDAINRSGKFTIGETAIREGLGTASWPGRLELFHLDGCLLIIDGAHNPQGADKLTEFVHTNFQSKAAIIFGSLRTKDTIAVIDAIQPITAKAYTVDVGNPLAVTAGELRKLFVDRAIPAVLCPSLDAALTLVVSTEKLIIVCGSLYLAGAARRFAKKYEVL